jgi:peroxiredoxin
VSGKGNDRRRTVGVAALAALLVTVLAAAGCGGTGDAPSADEAGAAQGSGAGADGAKIETLDGEEFDLAEKRGEVVALFFMAGWCGNCIPEAQAWSKLYPEYKDRGLEVLMVSADPNDTPKTIEGFRKAGGIGDLPWAIDGTGDLTRSLGVRALDSTVIFDREGKVAYRDAAPTDAETLEKELEEVL